MAVASMEKIRGGVNLNQCAPNRPAMQIKWRFCLELRRGLV
jgi:hypothetical protein